MQQKVSSLYNVQDWLERIYPSLLNLHKPVMAPFIEQPVDHVGYRPLECIQKAGINISTVRGAVSTFTS